MKRSLQLRKRFFALLLVLGLGMGTAFASDFSAVCTTGQTLYYNIIDATNHYVEITYPGTLGNLWGGYEKPTGNIILPTSATYNDITYTVTKIGDYAFEYCSGLTGSLNIPDPVVSIGISAFEYCSGFTGNLTIPNSVTTIGDYAFNYCSGFTGGLTIPNSVTAIGVAVFNNCGGFTGNLTIPNSVTKIGFAAFQACRGFTGDLTIPNSVTEIGAFAFMNCLGFTGSLIIGDSVTKIDSCAFTQCVNFTGTLTISNSVTTIGYGAFYLCRNFTGNLMIPNSVTTIGDKAFYNCRGFTGLTLGNSVTTIGDYAFQQCTSFTGDLIIPNSVTTIGLRAFNTCAFSGSLIIGDSVTEIGNEAFYGSGLFSGSLIIGRSVDTIGYRAFVSCNQITSLCSRAETPPSLGASVFSNAISAIPVYVPCASLADYQMASGWNAFSNWQCNMCAPKSLPYAYGFEEADEMDCWTMEDCHDYTGRSAVNGNYVFQFWYTENPPQYLISPELESTTDVDVSFRYRNDGNEWPETFQVGYSTTTKSPDDFTWGDELTAENSEWMHYENIFPAGTKYVAIKHLSYDQNLLFLDSFSFEPVLSCSEPSGLTVANITSNSAELCWTGDQDCYNVRYRMVPGGSWKTVSFGDNFESGLGNWTLIDADGDGQNWSLNSDLHLNVSPHGGDDFAISVSWTGADDPDNFLVTPLVALGGTVTFWASVVDPINFTEHFGIAVSTGSNTDPADFTMVQEWTMTAKGEPHDGPRSTRSLGTWYQYTVDLSAYAGQTGYIAIRYFNCPDSNALFVDDFSYGNEVPSITLGDLNPLTTYEVQMQGVCPYGFSDWSEPVSFTTAIPTFPYGDYLGTALYEVQTNSGARTWTHVWPDGKVNFAFMTASIQGYSDRGTGIGTYDSANDVWIPSMGRVENERTGFGSIAQYGASGIVVAAHMNTSNIYIIPDKDDIATGSAVKVGSLDSTHEPYWPNVMTSGANRDIIHVIAQGSDDFVVYYFRSRDGGQTWDRQNVILPYMGTDYCINWRVNCCYWMETTDDNCLALVVNNPWSDGMVLYSYDDGDTWERKVFYKHPNPFGSFEDPIYYPRWTSCQWDSQHHLHVLYELGALDSNNEYLDLGGVAYWNETMPYNANGTTVSAFEGNLVPGQPFVLESAYLENDIYRSWWHYTDATHEMWPEYMGYLAPLTDDGDPEDPYQASGFNIENEDLGQHGYYRSGVCGYPVLCMVPNSDEMVAVWSALDENHMDVNGNYYYKIFASYSKNKGATWSPMVQLTMDFDNAEFVYNQAAVVGRKLVIATQTDGETGTYYNGYYGTDTDVYDSYYLGMVFDLDDLFDTSSSAQTIALSAGTNWISTYVNITLDDLKAALVDALPGTTMTIKSQDAYTLYNGSRWRGSLNTYDAAQMYMVIITDDCEITLEGEPVNPADISITIGLGSNWIGFPFSESMSVADAFAGFNATANDMLKSQSGYTLYNGTRWRGGLTTFEPGQGYIYNSTAAETKTFTFPTGER